MNRSLIVGVALSLLVGCGGRGPLRVSSLVWVVAQAPPGDTAVLPGNYVRIGPQLANDGDVLLRDVRGTLTSRTSDATIAPAHDTGSYRDLPPGGTSGTHPSSFELTVAPGARCGERLRLRLTVTFTGAPRSPQRLDIDVPVGRPTPSGYDCTPHPPPPPIPSG